MSEKSFDDLIDEIVETAQDIVYSSGGDWDIAKAKAKAEYKELRTELNGRIETLQNIVGIYKAILRTNEEQLKDYNKKIESLEVLVIELQSEVEVLKPYKYGYSTRKKPEFYTPVLVDYEGELFFGSLDDEGIVDYGGFVAFIAACILLATGVIDWQLFLIYILAKFTFVVRYRE